ncbi:peptidase C69 [Candidatus Woesebacteria bacterium RIFCSPHIGHO2_01_FULL_39_28]|uniref:Peptidase C69 n=1 Tax=Candidatus Woesebacteria bacterium RIFCSPHIGHO2_01_FULL_39_28 TaxID=1802496 RepID=A0A1F7YB45_9BACT|nr:MAG: peptidase C69 [Candidatus Woesebacteria bacterium RIFCSPHIGHO2_01_FULL_39_28]OGM58382.1 MAG: peptidase C69 [Candidatus Woesebacteria bacterium RIFCSPLOWO2_01_FULL_38_20]
MKKQALEILRRIPKVDYADVRVVEKESEYIATKDGVVEALESSKSLGFGVRVLTNGSWGFAGSNNFSKIGIEKTARKAVLIAQTSSKYKSCDVRLTPLKAVKADYKTPVKEDPFKVPMESKINLLIAADNAQRVSDKIVISQTSFSANKETKTFVSSIGSEIVQEILWTGAGIEASASDGSDFQNRSYPNSHGGQFATRGFELVREMDLIGNAPRIAGEAVSLLTAPICPTAEFDLILDSNQLALQIHESCGHATELDRVLGYEASYAGTSFLTPEKLGKFKYGSKIVNLTADATISGGLGTFGYDDEGVPAQKVYLVKDGIFVDYQTSRETVEELKKIVPKYKAGSNGTMRAVGWGYIPLIRMTNVNLEPGAWKMQDLISDTKRGILMSTNKSWSIDDKRLNFQFGTEIAWEIKNGKKARIFKNPTYQGMTPKFWGSCDAICGRDEWVVWGTPNCGKGQPSQVMYTGHGASPARFRKVKVGVVKKW